MKNLSVNQNIVKAREDSLLFTERLYEEGIGYKYTLNHDAKKYPVAVLYGTWSVAYLKKLILGNRWTDTEDKEKILSILKSYRLKNGIFYPIALDHIRYPKSREYMFLHCYNYAVGAALEINPLFDFQSSFMDEFLNADFLERWLNQRSLERPWEESNNIVNVASYLALCNDNGNPVGKERLYQMLEWHNKVQNPKTGGFDNFPGTGRKVIESMAGAVHNFHIHHYLGEEMRYEKKIAGNLISYLFQGPLSACLSIDFVELACKTINSIEERYLLEQALLYHLNALLKYQNKDGGWYENETPGKPTTANGMNEIKASSNSYSTWFRMCSIGMISITLLGQDPENWSFRKTLGMGYSNGNWNIIKPRTLEVDKELLIKLRIKGLPDSFKSKIISTASKFLK